MWTYKKITDIDFQICQEKKHWKLLRNTVEYQEQSFHLRSYLCQQQQKLLGSPKNGQKWINFLLKEHEEKYPKVCGITKSFIVLEVFCFQFCQILLWGSQTSQVMPSGVTVKCYFVSAQYPKWWVKSVILVVKDTDILHSFLISLLLISPMDQKIRTQTQGKPLALKKNWFCKTKIYCLLYIYVYSTGFLVICFRSVFLEVNRT